MSTLTVAQNLFNLAGFLKSYTVPQRILFNLSHRTIRACVALGIVLILLCVKAHEVLEYFSLIEPEMKQKTLLHSADSESHK